jgi:hypothetical protein
VDLGAGLGRLGDGVSGPRQVIERVERHVVHDRSLLPGPAVARRDSARPTYSEYGACGGR